MANQRQVARVENTAKWNQWRKSNPGFPIDLSGANLTRLRLSGANLSRANLSKARLSGSNLHEADLSRADLRETEMIGANLREANLREANLSRANLREAEMIGANLREANLIDSNLQEANLNRVEMRRANLCTAKLSQASLHEACLLGAKLREANLNGASLNKVNLSRANLFMANLSSVALREANLHEANLFRADLRGTDLSGADLSGANLTRIHAHRTSFSNATFTGACLENWNINSPTKFDGAICEHVYLKADHQERRPRAGVFKLGEFAALFQQAVDTVDLIFKDGIDWQAFFQSFQELRSQYADQDLSIQAIEKKRGGAFVVRVEVAEGADKSSIESDAKQLYESQLKKLEAQYERQLRLQGAHLKEIQSILKDERQERTRLSKVVEKMADVQQAPKYDLRGAQFAGGFAETVQGNQVGGTINNTYGLNTEDITRLLTALRDQAQTFPTDQKDEALDTLDDLEGDLAKPDPDQPRIGRRLKKLVTLEAALALPTSDFTTNVIELTEKLGIPIEQIQLPPSDTQ